MEQSGKFVPFQKTKEEILNQLSERFQKAGISSNIQKELHQNVKITPCFAPFAEISFEASGEGFLFKKTTESVWVNNPYDLGGPQIPKTVQAFTQIGSAFFKEITAGPYLISLRYDLPVPSHSSKFQTQDCTEGWNGEILLLQANMSVETSAGALQSVREADFEAKFSQNSRLQFPTSEKVKLEYKHCKIINVSMLYLPAWVIALKAADKQKQILVLDSSRQILMTNQLSDWQKTESDNHVLLSIFLLIVIVILLYLVFM